MWRIASTVSLKLPLRHCRVTSTRHNEVMRSSSSVLSLPWKSSSCPPNTTSFEAGNSHHYMAACSDGRDNRRFFSSTTRYYKKDKTKTTSKQIKINRLIVALGKDDNWRGILNVYDQQKEYFDHVNYATSMNQLGRIQSFQRDDIRLEEMMINAATQLQNRTKKTWGTQEMANVLHALAKMELRLSGSRRYVLHAVAKTPSTSTGSRRLVAIILGEENLEILLEKGTTQEIANTAWACATLGVRCPTLFKAIDDNALHLIENGTNQNIVNTAWACATLGVKCRSLFKAIDDNALKLVQNGKPQDIAIAAWACAKLGIECPILFKAIVTNALSIFEKGNKQDMVNLVWAFARLGLECPPLFQSTDDDAFSFSGVTSVKSNRFARFKQHRGIKQVDDIQCERGV